MSRDGQAACQKRGGFLRWSCLDAKHWMFVIHSATWEWSTPEEADGPARKDVVWNEEQCGAGGQWN